MEEISICIYFGDFYKSETTDLSIRDIRTDFSELCAKEMEKGSTCVKMYWEKK